MTPEHQAQLIIAGVVVYFLIGFIWNSEGHRGESLSFGERCMYGIFWGPIMIALLIILGIANLFERTKP